MAVGLRVTVGLWQLGYELQWACGSGVTSYSGPVAVGLSVTVHGLAAVGS